MNKKNFLKGFRFLYLSVCISLLLMGQAMAYLDPATTSYIIQIFAGVFIAIGTIVGIFWKKIRLFFRNMKMKMLEKKLEAQASKKQEQE